MPGRTFEGPPVHQPSNGFDPASGSQRQWPETPSTREVQGDAIGGEVQHQIGHFRTNGLEAALKPPEGPGGGLRQGANRSGQFPRRVAWQQPEYRAQQGQRIVAADPAGTRRAVHPTDPYAGHVSPVDPDGPGVAERDEYGWSAVIEGDVIAVGAPYHDVMGEDTGAVFIFERIDGEWVETAYLLPPYPDPLGWFGRWLAIGDGRIVIGAPYEDGRADDGSRIDDSGVAYVYEKLGGQWTRTGTLLPHVPYAGASFGWSVAISGDRIAVAAWEAPLFGMQTGSVTIFTQHKGLWTAEAVLQPSEASERMMFGRDIELHDNVLVVGAPGDDTIAEDAGAVYVWHHYNDEWNFAGKLVASDGIANDRLGSQVALQSPWLAAGAYDHDDPFWSAGATYVWKLDNLLGFPRQARGF